MVFMVIFCPRIIQDVCYFFVFSLQYSTLLCVWVCVRARFCAKSVMHGPDLSMLERLNQLV